MQYGDGSTQKKARKVERPKDADKEQTFLRMCSFFEENDEEQLTVTDLANKINEYLEEQDSVAYGNQYLKSKLLEHYGESIFVAEGKGLHDIVTFREKTSSILRNYFSKPEMDEEGQKRDIIKTAGKLIKSDIKSMILPSTDQYPKASQVEQQSALEYIPPSLRLLLQNLLVGKNIHKKKQVLGNLLFKVHDPGLY